MTMPQSSPTVTVRGDVPDEMVAYAREKLDAAIAQVPAAVLGAEVHLDHHTDPARPAVYHVEMAADVNGNVVRARQSAASITEAIDGAESRLRRRITRAQDRPRALRDRHRDETGWHHDDEPAARPPYFPRPVDERMVLRRQTLATRPESIEEAIDDLEELDNEFLLFVHNSTNAEAVVHRAGDGYGIRQRVATPVDLAAVGAPLEIGPPPATTTVEEALHTLDESGEPFVFFVDAETGHGMVGYHRYDGHYGLSLTE